MMSWQAAFGDAPEKMSCRTLQISGNMRLGAPDGVDFDAFQETYAFGGVSINAVGQVVFAARLRGNVNFEDDFGVWAQDRNGVLRLVAREGDTIDVDDGPDSDLRTIRSLVFRTDSLYPGMQGGGLNDAGQVAFFASFTDGTSGIFVSEIATIPETTTLNMFIVASFALIAKVRPVRKSNVA
jgi:hypothetical protein